jgi:hypothetical protein
VRSGAQAKDAKIPRVYKEICWQEWQDSNLQPPVLETGALAIELHSCRHFAFCIKAAALASRHPRVRLTPPPPTSCMDGTWRDQIFACPLYWLPCHDMGDTQKLHRTNVTGAIRYW